MGSSQSSPLANVHVVVVGGSLASKSIITELDKLGARITLVAPQDRLYVAFGGVRAACKEGYEDTLLLPYTKLFKGNAASLHLRALATGVDAAGRSLRVQPVDAHGQVDASQPARELAYDFLILATGLHAPAPWRAPPSVPHFKHQLGAMRAALRGASSVCVVGGGMVGVEFVGEIKHAFPALAVHLVTTGAALLEHDPVHPMLRDLLLAECVRLGIQVTLGARAEGLAELGGKPGVAQLAPGAYASTAAGTPISLALVPSGRAGAPPPPPSLAADVVFSAVSSGKPATAWLAGSPAVPLDAAGYIAVEPTYQVRGLSNVFALGDAAAAAGDIKDAFTTKGQAAIIAHNIRALVAEAAAGKSSAPKPAALKRGPAARPPVFIVPVGPSGGYAQVPGILRPNFISFIARFKAGKFIADMMGKEMGLTEAEVKAANEGIAAAPAV